MLLSLAGRAAWPGIEAVVETVCGVSRSKYARARLTCSLPVAGSVARIAATGQQQNKLSIIFWMIISGDGDAQHGDE
jgi:hypothetical protein